MNWTASWSTGPVISRPSIAAPIRGLSGTTVMLERSVIFVSLLCRQSPNLANVLGRIPCQELAYPFRRRRRKELLGVVGFDNAAVVHKHDAVGGLARKRHLMRHHEHGHT